MLGHGLSGSESTRDCGSTAFGDRKHRVDDPLSGDKRNGCRKPVVRRTRCADRPVLGHGKVFCIPVRELQTDKKIINGIRSVCHRDKNGSFDPRRNHTFMGDRMGFGNLCDDIPGMEIISLLYSNVGGPFFCTIQ